ncbi:MULTISPECIES: FtsB family cell division protein [Rothia]|uniref:Septum formation initiator n=1 Tax=Rothia aeria TaxID=172042 RepID=A0A7Z9D604_9MICC|nr:MULTISPECIES: septum formation initiator family protein [Rothia]MDO4883695.1 septum formation initiator family protein [Rothia sp. (in: high G+C Gram-positive bacteria)]VEI22415.1 Septum formation initiator [Rothia aeria]
MSERDRQKDSAASASRGTRRPAGARQHAAKNRPSRSAQTPGTPKNRGLRKRTKSSQAKGAGTSRNKQEQQDTQRSPSTVGTLTSAVIGAGRSPRRGKESPQLARQRRMIREGSSDQDPDELTPIAARGFSGQFLVGAIIVVALLVGTYPTLNNYFTQLREIESTREHISQLQRENAQLKVEKTWWDDENYVRQQARSRLFYVNEGDTPYAVTGIDSNNTQVDDTSASAKNAPDDSWTNKMWNSVENPQGAQKKRQ